jgi:hypothetical protein
MAKMLDAALEHAKQDTPVFPCRTDDKSPLTPNGYKDATTDEKQITLWWTQYPSAMIGMPTGKASGRWVLDLDIDASKGLNGIKELEKLVAKNGPLPKTRSSKTPRGGMHLFFAYTGAVTIKNSTSKLAPGIDVRGEGGYVILPPSVTADGGSYSWCDNSNFAADTWVPNQLASASPRTRTWAKNALEKECATVAAAAPGTRNGALNTASFNLFQIVAGGALDEDDVRNELYTAAVACGLVDDDGEATVWATIESGAKAGRQQPRYRSGNGSQAAVVPAPAPSSATPPPPPPPPSGTPGGSAAPAAGPTPIPMPPPPLPRIRLIEGELPTTVDEAEDALLAAKKHIYQRGGMVVRPIRQRFSAANNRTTFAWELVEVTKAYLVETFTEVARFEKMNYRLGDYVPKNCPEQIADVYLARSGEWKLPLLLGVVNCPFLRVDGSICERPGYDLDSALLFIPGGQTFPAIPQNPALEDARAALKYLDETLLSEFPFIADVDHSVALSAMLTAFDRRSMATAPLHALSSPTAGTGKSLLVDMISMLLTGQLAPVLSQGKNDEEYEKRLDSALLCSDQIISTDNCDRELTSNRLCQALTQQIVKVRLLGYSQHVNIPVSSVFYATGNNLIISDDLTRRTLLCGMDAHMAQPELRTFKSNVLEQARSQRGKLVCAALTVLRMWHAPGTAVGVAPALGSFEDWSFRVRSPLMLLGQADPVLSMETVRKNDPARLGLSAVLMQWREKLGTTTPYTSQQVINRAVVDADFFGALMAVAASRQGNVISPDRLGRYLATNNGKIIDYQTIGSGKPLRLKIDRGSVSARGQLWQVIEV